MNITQTDPTTTEYRLSFSELNLTRGDIETALGYGAGQAPEPIPDMLDELLTQVGAHCDIRGGYRFFDALGLDKELVTVNGTVLKTGKTIANRLRGSQSSALFVCTAGAGMTDWSRSLMSGGDVMSGYLVDAIASETVERAMDLIQDRLEQDLLTQKNLRITNRFSPGYCEWHVSGQQEFFGLLPPSFCGITINESSLMHPIKSISGIIGLGPTVKRIANLCDLCNMKECLYGQRRKKMSMG